MCKKYCSVNSVLKVDGYLGNFSVQFLLDSGDAVSVIVIATTKNKLQ